MKTGKRSVKPFEKYIDCSCCKGFIYNCDDNSCLNLGICGCAFGDAPQNLNLSAELDFHPEKEPCSCCKGNVYNCSKESIICDNLGICGCCYEETFCEDRKDCPCCRGFIYACEDDTPICKKLGSCSCTVSTTGKIEIFPLL